MFKWNPIFCETVFTKYVLNTLFVSIIEITAKIIDIEKITEILPIISEFVKFDRIIQNKYVKNVGTIFEIITDKILFLIIANSLNFNWSFKIPSNLCAV